MQKVASYMIGRTKMHRQEVCMSQRLLFIVFLLFVANVNLYATNVTLESQDEAINIVLNTLH